MKLSFSNIAWTAGQDEAMYAALAARGFSGIEIAPTRLFAQEPYAHTGEAAAFAEGLRAQYRLEIPSMQSIWFGRAERVFGTQEERAALLDYTRQAIDFARALGCRNLVFGCPKNREKPQGAYEQTALDFFRAAGRYAAQNGCVFALEANPPIYNTNYLNTTAEAFAAARACGEGVGVNLDLGAMLANGEPLAPVADNLSLVSHVHISEPYLAPVKTRELHRELAALLRAGGYTGYVSAEMKLAGEDEVLRAADELRAVFG